MVAVPTSDMDTGVRAEGAGGTADRTTLLLAVGDVVFLAGLVLVGQLSHGVTPIEQPVAALETVAPFVLGWLLVAAIAGLYTNAGAVATSVPRTARTTAVTWIAAANVGFILRNGLFGESTLWPFPLVMTGFGLLVLVGWRVGYAVFADSSGRP
ncbi:hypothetical protein Halxa_2513 [Halopiger xanaduensis SH-6]|uniref:DUF3054 domain-containing protein n=2 Tax=Halopiger xanaduensis TaxID=387343 RepID=F8D8Z3_HALXS|nr:hypothetical protein Halxa_2513 [Halopiger xanaduensis SH-6]